MRDLLVRALPISAHVRMGPESVAADNDVRFFEQEYTLGAWLAAWLDGSLRQPWLVTDPTSGQYRGATIAETEAALADTECDEDA